MIDHVSLRLRVLATLCFLFKIAFPFQSSYADSTQYAIPNSQMPTLTLKPTHKPIRAYYAALERFDRLGVSHESAARSAFQALLEHCARQCAWTLVPEQAIAPLLARGASNTARGNKRIIVDGALIDDFQLTHGIWEAKNIHDDLLSEARRKFEAGYPHDNILFQTPQRAIIWQNGRQVLDADLSDPAHLIETLETFFSYLPQEYAAWEEAVAQCKDRVPDIGRGLARLIHKERQSNRRFATAFAGFLEKCRQSINPNLSAAAIEEMLIQHLLTERLFRTVFNNPDFTQRNVIANEIEKVINALTSQSFSRGDFLHSLDRFYLVIERVAATISDFSQKQHFLNTVYEQFFQGFSLRVADTHGIVYTPQPIVDFMAQSVAHILQTEFGRSLSDPGVHIIDPFVGTGNFIVRLMREIRRTDLEDKYRSELHCNEVMLLPYYIASMNIEHEFYEATDTYQPFEGICLVDTFDLAEDRQLPLFAPANAQRLETQKPMFVVIGNPPYNVGQVNENDNNKNRNYGTLDKRVAETYAHDSKATNKNRLSDPYVKAIRWAADRIGEEGIVAFITNNSFLDGVAFDGMRQHLAQDFTRIYHIDLKGNARTSAERRRKEGGNIFDDQIRVGVGISFFIRKAGAKSEAAEVWIYSIDDYLKARAKQEVLTRFGDYTNVPLKQASIDARHTWLTEGLHTEFETFMPLGSKEAKATKGEAVDVIFHTFSNGVQTSRDAWACNFNRDALTENMGRMIDFYNEQVFKWKGRGNREANVDDFVVYDDKKIKWSSGLKQKLKGRQIAEFTEAKIRQSLYRPFTKTNLFFDRILTHRVFVFPSIFPTAQTETENRVIVAPSAGGRAEYWCFCAGIIPSLTVTSIDASQCFPFYTYDEDGTNRRENITDWALAQFRARYRDDTISKWDIFHSVYAILHHPRYRERYQANLKRDLPRLPFAPDFRAFAQAGARLAQIHVGYEEMPAYPLTVSENPGLPLDWRVEKMKLSRDKTQIRYNDFLTLDGIPAKAFDYRLGSRSALEWIIDQYRLKTDKRSGIVNDPNRADDPRYIVNLIGKVISVSLETVKIVEGLPALRL